MFSSRWWQEWFQELVDHIPRADGEYEGIRKRRIATRLGISRATLYDILAGKKTKLASIDGCLSALHMIPARHEDVRLGLIQKLFQIDGYHVERPDSEPKKPAKVRSDQGGVEPE